jgi:blue copper oxidase
VVADAWVWKMKTNFRPSLLCLVVIAAGWLWCGPSRAEGPPSVFANPPMLSSRDGRLHVDLTAALGAYTIDGHLFQGRLYNGAYMPPAWRLRSGDSLTVSLHNRLSEEPLCHRDHPRISRRPRKTCSGNT